MRFLFPPGYPPSNSTWGMVSSAEAGFPCVKSETKINFQCLMLRALLWALSLQVESVNCPKRHWAWSQGTCPGAGDGEAGPAL